MFVHGLCRIVATCLSVIVLFSAEDNLAVTVTVSCGSCVGQLFTLNSSSNTEDGVDIFNGSLVRRLHLNSTGTSNGADGSVCEYRGAGIVAYKPGEANGVRCNPFPSLI